MINQIINSTGYTNIENEKYNNLLKKFGLCKQIMGVDGLILYEINGKYVFLFQDWHGKPTDNCNNICQLTTYNCIWIQHFLRDLFLVSPFCIDFFHETMMFLQIPKNIIKYEGVSKIYKEKSKVLKTDHNIGLTNIMNEFADCLGPVKSGCEKYKKVRFHNIEFRRFVFESYNLDAENFTSIFQVPILYLCGVFDTNTAKNIEINPIINDINQFDIKKYDHKMKLYLDNIDEYKNIVKYLLSGDMGSLSQTIFKLFGSFDGNSVDVYLPNWTLNFKHDALKVWSPYPKLNKQLKSIGDDWRKTLESIFPFMFEEAFKYIDHIKSTRNQLDTVIQNNDLNKIKLYKQYIAIAIYNMQHHFSAQIFNVYAITRIMKSIVVYSDSSVIMVYAGLKHIDWYKIIFDAIEPHSFNKPKEITVIGKAQNKKYEACINLDTYKEGWTKVMDVLKSLNNVKTCATKQGFII